MREEGRAISEAYEGRQVVGIDLHRCRSVIVRMTEDGTPLESVQIVNSPESLTLRPAGEAPVLPCHGS